MGFTKRRKQPQFHRGSSADPTAEEREAGLTRQHYLNPKGTKEEREFHAARIAAESDEGEESGA